MFGYNPSVQDRSGELIGAGIGQAAQGISGAINTMNDLNMKKQAVAGADAAFRPFAKSDSNPNGIPGLSDALDNIKGGSNPYAQQMSYQLLGQFLPQALHSQQVMAGLGYKYDALGQKGSTGSGATTSF